MKIPTAIAVAPVSGYYWQEGPRKRGWVAASSCLLLIYIGGIAYAAAANFSLAGFEPWMRATLVVVALVLTLLPVLFWWRQSWHFETWLIQNPLALSANELEFEKNRFKTNSEFSRAFWSALVFIFTALLITSALKSPSSGTPIACTCSPSQGK